MAGEATHGSRQWLLWVTLWGTWGIGSFLIQFARSATAVDWASPGQASDQLVVGAWQ